MSKYIKNEVTTVIPNLCFVTEKICINLLNETVNKFKIN